MDIGNGLVTAYLQSPNTTVVAAVRNIASTDSLTSSLKSPGSRLVMIEIEVASVRSVNCGVAPLEFDHTIDRLDVVLANAGVAAVSPSLIRAGVNDIHSFLDVNAYGQLELSRAMAPLLRRTSSGSSGELMYMSSLGGSLTVMSTVAPLAAYGASKALGNFLFRWLSLE